MRKRTFIYLAFLAAALMSCRELENPAEQQRPDGVQTADVHLNLEIAAGFQTKAGSLQDDPETSLRNLVLISRPRVNASDADELSSSWTRAVVIPIHLRDNELQDDGTVYTITRTVTLPVGHNVVYLLVNHSHHMLTYVDSRAELYGLRLGRKSAYTSIDRFNEDGSIDPVTIDNFAELSEAVPSGFIPSMGADPERDGFAMMGKCVTRESGSTDVVVNPNNTNEVELNVTLHRMVARVRLTPETYPNGIYAKIEANADYSDGAVLPNNEPLLALDPETESQAGWMPVDDIRYMLNSTNTMVYIEPDDRVADRSYYPHDPNMYLDDILVQDGNNWVYRSDDEGDYSSDFLYITDEQVPQMFRKYWDTTAPSSIKGAGEWAYCLENMVNSRYFTLGQLPGSHFMQTVPRMATTHLIVEARFVPRYIVTRVEQNGEHETVRTFAKNATIGDALGCLESDGSFYTPDMHVFYNKIAMDQELALNPSLTFSKFERGRCYYIAYIQGQSTEASNGDHIFTYKDEVSSLRRDGQYDITATAFRVPSVMSVLMEVNTSTRIGWMTEGHGEVTIKP